jgi:drug/metabolite transporter (DMT)-like permease
MRADPAQAARDWLAGLPERVQRVIPGWPALPPNVRATTLLLVSFVFFTFEIVGAKMLGDRLPTAQVVFVRSLAQLILLAPFMALAGRTILESVHLPLHLMRSTFGLLGLFCYFYSFGNLPLANATTLSFTKALFLTIAAAVVLREAVGPRRWGATAIGLFGVLLVVRPGMEGFDAVSVIAIFGAMFGAGLMICTKMLTGLESTLKIMAFVAVITTSLSAIPGLAMWQAPDAFETTWLLVIGLFGPIGQFFGISAFRVGEASFLAPVDYLRLLISIVVGFLLFAEFPDVWTFLGAAVIVGSALYVNHREIQVARERAGLSAGTSRAPVLQTVMAMAATLYHRFMARREKDV